MSTKTTRTLRKVGRERRTRGTGNHEDLSLSMAPPETPCAALKDCEPTVDHLQSRNPANGIHIGEIVGISQSGELLVEMESSYANDPLRARSLTSIGLESIGREVALMFEEGDPTRPIVIGVIERPQPGTGTVREKAGNDSPTTDAEIDGESITLSARRELVLRCGEASITLTYKGKIVLRGTYVLSRSTGVNRILGGSVQIN
jgi:hypothetical protein